MIGLFSFVGRDGRVYRVPSWLIGVLAALMMLASLVLLLTVSAIALIALPIIVIAGIAYRLTAARSVRERPSAPAAAPGAGGVIEGDYRVVGTTESDGAAGQEPRRPDDDADAALGRA